MTNLFGYQSLLNDTCQHQDTKLLFEKSESLILDIDLDFFTYYSNKIFARNRRDIIKQITSDSFHKLISKAKIITLALEPIYCGSNEDCLEILTMFNEHIFKPKGIDILKEVENTFLTWKT